MAKLRNSAAFNDTFPERHVGPNAEQVAEMCRTLGVKDVEELMEQVGPGVKDVEELRKQVDHL